MRCLNAHRILSSVLFPVPAFTISHQALVQCCNDKIQLREMAFILKLPKPFSVLSRFVQKESSSGLFKGFHYRCSTLPLISTPLLRKFSTPNVNVNNPEALEKFILQLDIDTRLKQKISIRDVEEILSAIRNWSNFNYHHSLLLLKCCGSLSLHAIPRERIELVKRVMSIMEELGIEANVVHYNALLSAYIDNEHKFSPSEFLNLLKEKNIEPNKVTYQRLLKAYCQQGDMASASRLLEEMKDKGMGINEDIFNSLILGHCQVNDMESAISTLELMEGKGIQPSSESYMNLLCGFAKVGDFNKIKEIMQECEAKGIIFLNKNMFELAYVLALNNHFDLVDEILKKTGKEYGYKAHARTYSLRLLQKRMDKAALKIYKSAVDIEKIPEADRNYGKYMVEYYVKYRSPKETIKFCLEAEKEGILHTPISMALYEVFKLDNFDKHLQFISEMRKQNLFVRPHYFWPLIILASKKGNEGILKVLMTMNKLRVVCCYNTCTKIVYPNYSFTDNFEQDIEKLSRAGASKMQISTKLFITFMSENKLNEAKKLAGAMPLNVSLKPLMMKFVDSLLTTRNADFFVNVLHDLIHDFHVASHNKAAESDSSSDSDTNENKEFKQSEFIKTVMEKVMMHNCDEPLLVNVLENMMLKGIRIHSDVADLIKSKFDGKDVHQLVDKLTDNNFQLELDSNILNFKKGSWEHTDMEFKKKLHEMFSHVRSNELEKATDICKELPASCNNETFTSWEEKQYKRYLMELARTGNDKSVESAFNVGLELKIISPKNFYPLVTARVVRGDLNAAAEVFCNHALQTKCTSSWSTFVPILINAQNSELLQKVTNTMGEIRDEVFSMSMLLSQFAKLGKVKEIVKLLDSKGHGLSNKSINNASVWLFKEKLTEGLENLLSATKTSNVNRQYMYCCLLKLYIAEGNDAKAKGLLLQLQEENVTPNRTFMIDMNNLCEKLQEPIPFNI